MIIDLIMASTLGGWFDTLSMVDGVILKPLFMSFPGSSLPKSSQLATRSAQYPLPIPSAKPTANPIQ